MVPLTSYLKLREEYPCWPGQDLKREAHARWQVKNGFDLLSPTFLLCVTGPRSARQAAAYQKGTLKSFVEITENG